MTESPEVMEDVRRRLQLALDHADLTAFADLLDPDVHWGAPGDPKPACRSKDQVLEWYGRGRASGGHAEVTETVVLDDQILVGLVVHGTKAARARGGDALRWQLYRVSGGRVSAIVGFDDRSDAVSYAQARPGPSGRGRGRRRGASAP